MSEEKDIPDNINKSDSGSKAEIKSSAKYLGNITATASGVINYAGATSALDNAAVVKASASKSTPAEQIPGNCQNNKDLSTDITQDGGKNSIGDNSEDQEQGEINSDLPNNSTDVFEFSCEEGNTTPAEKTVGVPVATFYNTRVFGKPSECSSTGPGKHNNVQSSKGSVFDNNNDDRGSSGQSSISREISLEAGPDHNRLEIPVGEISGTAKYTGTNRGEVIPSKTVRVNNDISPAKIVDVTGDTPTKRVQDPSAKSANAPSDTTASNVDCTDDVTSNSEQARPLKKRKTEDSIMQQMESIHGNKDNNGITRSSNISQNENLDTTLPLENTQILERVEDANTSINILHHTLKDVAERTPANKPEASNFPPISKHYTAQDVEDLTVTKRQLFGANTRSMVAQPPVLMSYKMKKTKVSKSKRSGITFPVTRTLHKLQRGRYARHIGVGAGVYMAAVLEYLVAEVLELSGAFTKDDARVRITPRHIMLTLRMDRELDELTKDTTIPQSGVTPCIHPALLPSSTSHQPVDFSKLKYPNDPYRGHTSTPKP